MAILNYLVKKFSEVTSQKSDDEKETILYGTAYVSNDDSTITVALDGSTIRCPATTTVDVNNEDRVAVTVTKNEYVITDNVTNPGASILADAITTGTSSSSNTKIAEAAQKLADAEKELEDAKEEINGVSTVVTDWKKIDEDEDVWINGNKIYAGTVLADRIAADQTFTQAITATDLTITGGSVNITTSSATEDAIVLNYKNWASGISPYYVWNKYYPDTNDKTKYFIAQLLAQNNIQSDAGLSLLYIDETAESEETICFKAEFGSPSEPNVVIPKLNNGTPITSAGGTVTGTLAVSNSNAGYVTLRNDSEGGNIDIGSPDGGYWEIDAYNNNLRAYRVNSSGTYVSTPFTVATDGVYSLNSKVITAANIGSQTVNTAYNICALDGNTSRGIRTSNSSGCGINWMQKASDTNNLLTNVSGLGTYANSISAISDEKLKKNIENSEVNALEVINSVPVRQWDWDCPTHTGSERIGAVAQEMEKVIPEAVVEIEQPDGNIYGLDSVKMIDYPKVVPFLMKAIQELSAEVETLKPEIQSMREA